MELYLDSVDFKEIEEALKLGTIDGLTTTPTFMHRHGITDVDGAILKLAKMVNVLQVEALGDTVEEVEKEADRLIALGLDPEKTVFKIPVSNIGIAACKRLRSKGYMVNIHLVYTLSQAYMAMHAGATYVCPLVGRLQDQGHDALTLIEQCVEAVNYYGYDTKIMFSSVRHAEHVRTALLTGVHTITAPWSVMKKLTENNLTTVGTDQFIEHTKLMTMRVNEIIAQYNPRVSVDQSVLDAVVEMNKSGLGSVSVVDASGQLVGVFTDGDLRRKINADGKAVLDKKLSDFEFKYPITINSKALLYEAVDLFKKHEIDNIVVLENNELFGMLDIQDFVKLDLIG
ncbi:MAG: CBS domain-containing protein [Bacteroidetes bacterium]|nr:MAG: CBS domain-containing protein [Bacteroidota bacterium]